MHAWALAVGLAAAAVLGSAAAQVPEAYRDGGSYYEEVARDALSLGIQQEDTRDTSCRNDVYSQNPCPEVIGVWYAFTDRHGLPRNQTTADMLRAYIEQDYEVADRLYAGIKGYTLPGEANRGPSAARAVRRHNIERALPGDVSCNNDILSAKPCPAAIKAWNEFAAEHGLTLNRQTASMFEAYIEGDTRQADRLFAEATQQKPKQPHNELLASAKAYGVKRQPGTEVGECQNNYYANMPCLEAVQAWRLFAEEHGLELNRQSADMFEAYVEEDPVLGDKLYAAAKGISVAELLEKRGHKIDRPTGDPLYVPIYPAGAGR